MAKRCPVCGAVQDGTSLGARLAVSCRAGGSGKVEAGAAGAEKAMGIRTGSAGACCATSRAAGLSAGSLRLRRQVRAARRRAALGRRRGHAVVATGGKVAVPRPKATRRRSGRGTPPRGSPSRSRCPGVLRPASPRRPRRPRTRRGAARLRRAAGGRGQVFDGGEASAVRTKAWGGEQTDRPTHVFDFDVDPSVAACLAGTK